MPRLVHPTAGTVVHVGDSLAERYRAAGWGDGKPRQERAVSEKPVEDKSAPRRRQSKK